MLHPCCIDAANRFRMQAVKRQRLIARRTALGLTQGEVGKKVGVDRSTIGRCENGGTAPQPWVKRGIAQVLRVPIEEVPALFELVDESEEQSTEEKVDLRTEQFLGWFDEHGAFGADVAYERLLAAVTEMQRNREKSWKKRSTLGWRDLSNALRRFYEPSDAGRFYTALVDDVEVPLSVCTPENGPDDVAVALGTASAKFTFSSAGVLPFTVGQEASLAAVRRLAQVEVGETVIVDNPLYRLTSVDMTSSTIDVGFAESRFLDYALTADLLEKELVDCASSEALDLQDAVLRRQFLPTIEMAFDWPSRVCVGGVQALLAIARGTDDYVLLSQVRSSKVLNLVGHLALIPKAFHQPCIEPAYEAPIEKTLERELEEELFGRDDLDMLGDDRRADPLHPAFHSEPMRWLFERRGSEAYRMECTGFGINMVTGNYEFTCLIVIDDPTWWQSFGHRLEANWETTRLQRYSTRDPGTIASMAIDPRWSNEGLFAFLQGLRRLAVIGDPQRIQLPRIGIKI